MTIAVPPPLGGMGIRAPIDWPLVVFDLVVAICVLIDVVAWWRWGGNR